MSFRTHAFGLDALSADAPQGLLIRIKNAAELARSSGKAGAAAQYFADKFGAQRAMERQVLQGISDEMRGKFKDKGVNADLSIVAVPSLAPARGAMGYVGAGLLGAGAVGLAWAFAKWGRR